VAAAAVAGKLGFEPHLLELIGEPPNYAAAASACKGWLADQAPMTRGSLWTSADPQEDGQTPVGFGAADPLPPLGLPFPLALDFQQINAVEVG
jgi:hypothetical protein